MLESVASAQFIRGRRLCAPPFCVDELMVAAPPLVRPTPAGIGVLMPLLAIATTLGTGAVIWLTGGAMSRNPMTLAFPAMMLMSSVGMVVNASGRRGATELNGERRRYLDLLDRLAGQLSKSAELQHESLSWIHPEPGALWTLIGGCRMWERRRSDADFLHVRIGIGDRPHCRKIVTPEVSPDDVPDPVSANYLRRFIEAHTQTGDMPLSVSVSSVEALNIGGEASTARGLARAVICQLAAFHSPADVMIAAVVTDISHAQWEWLKWLPHNTYTRGRLGHRTPLLFDSGEHARAELAQCLSGEVPPHIVLVIDGGGNLQPQFRYTPGVTVLGIGEGAGEPRSEEVRLRLCGEQLSISSDKDVTARVDAMSVAEARLFARRMARYRLDTPTAGGLQAWCTAIGMDAVANIDIGAIDIGAIDIGAIDIGALWEPPHNRNELRVPIGRDDGGGLVYLDIKESSKLGMGPHGLCVGATGSGKSELLRTLVLGLAMTNSPDELNFVLIDFKGGATFLGLEGLNHVSAVITNLADEAALVARMHDALAGEIHRRQQLFRSAHNAANLADYRRLCEGESLPRLPTLFIVVDEFAELLQHNPDFIDLFAAICRVGRSLGMHLLLASQRLDDGRLRGLESYLSYRICLKTLTASESRGVLGVGDAADLPGIPGSGYLQTSVGTLTRFRAFFLSSRHPGSLAKCEMRNTEMPLARNFEWVSVRSSPVRDDIAPAATVLEVIVDQLAGRGSRAHQVWLPPLDSPPALAELQKEVSADLSAVIGVIDLPFEQRRVPLVVQTGCAGGNIAIVGAPQSGKSSAVRATITALALRHESRRVQFYCLDFGGGGLSALRALPHVGVVAGQHDRDLTRRTINQIESIMRSRQMQRADMRSESVLDFQDGYGDVYLVVDGWSALREAFGDCEPIIIGIAEQGLSVGVHLVLTASRWADIRSSLKDLIGTRIELRLGDPFDSESDRKQAALVPASKPGRGLTSDGKHFALALPGLDRPITDQWHAPPILLLPERCELEEILPAIAVGERELAPIALDFTRYQHLLIVGDGECGKTSGLRALCRSIGYGNEGREEHPAELLVVDYRRGLLSHLSDGIPAGEAMSNHAVSNYAFSPGALAKLMPTWLGRLESRLPPPDASLDQLRSRSWWTGPEIFVVVDDYDLVAVTPGDPLNQLLPMLPYARDIGLHLVLARRCAGISRAMFEPLLGQLRESGCMVLLMSGSPEEGPVLGGRRLTSLPVGRGLLVTRDDEQLVQLGWLAP